MADIKEKTVPPQYTGAKKDIEHLFTATDKNDAQKLFFIARHRLLDMNRWNEYAQGLSAKFTLTDSQGNDVERTAEIHDHLKIALPAPGPGAADGFDWVYIEEIEELNKSAEDYESIAVRVRPASNPTSTGENVAHFFKDEATSSFVIERKDNLVTAAVYGRNEVINTDTNSIIDKIRNTVVGITAIAGLSNVQWNGLVKGLIAIENK